MCYTFPMGKDVIIEPEWKEVLKEYLSTPQFENLSQFVREEYLHKKVFPNPKDVFKAFWATPFSQVKVVILGQDPYHDDGQAEGMSFSVPEGVLIPPSLRNIYSEIESDLNIKKDYRNGHLEDWAKQGVFLLNAILTVVAHTPASHRGKGWEGFTDKVIQTISDKHEHIVFMLWGNYAKGKASMINENKHLVLTSPHPSPLSAHAGFLGCKHFSQCNTYLKLHNKAPVRW